MAEWYKGNIYQIDQVEGHLSRSQHKRLFRRNDVVFSSLSEIDLTLDTSRYQICCPLKGTEPYVVDGQTYDIHEDEFLILNAGQHARAEGEARQPIEGLCFLLDPEVVEEVWSQRLSKHEILTQGVSHPPVGFHVGKFKLAENSLGQYLALLKRQLSDPGRTYLSDWQEFFYALSEKLVDAFEDQTRTLDRIKVNSTARKIELLQRLSRARSFIHDNYKSTITIEMISREALISKYHLIRCFKLAYGLTPYQYLLKVRIEKAKTLLLSGMSPGQCALELSFSDRRTFSKAFKRFTGRPPSLHKPEITRSQRFRSRTNQRHNPDQARGYPPKQGPAL